MPKKHRRTITISGERFDRTFATKKEASEWYEQNKRIADRLKAGLPVANKDEKMAVVAARWITLRSKTTDYWKDDERKMRKALVPALGNKSIRSISKSDCEAALHDARNRLELIGATFNRYRTCLHTFFEFAIEEGYRETNPITHVKKMAEVERGAHIPNELVKAYIEHMHANEKPVFFAIMVLAMNSGARAGELLALTWSDFDKAKLTRSFQIVRRYQRQLKRVKEGTKGGGGRPIPLNDFALKAIESFRKITEHTKPDDYIFHRPDGSMISTSTLDKVHDRVAKAAGIADDVRPYDITRHKFASEVTQRFGLRAAQSMLGHASSTTTERYAHHDSKALINQVSRAVVVGGAQKGKKHG